MGIQIFTVIFLIAVVVEIHCTLNKGFSPEVMKCLERLNISVPIDYIEHLNFDNLSKTEKMVLTCSSGCACKQESVRTGQTMYQVVLRTLNKGLFGPVNNVDALKQKLEPCADVEEECKFMECLDIFNPPWEEVISKIKN